MIHHILIPLFIILPNIIYCMNNENWFKNSSQQTLRVQINKVGFENFDELTNLSQDLQYVDDAESFLWAINTACKVYYRKKQFTLPKSFPVELKILGELLLSDSPTRFGEVATLGQFDALTKHAIQQ